MPFFYLGAIAALAVSFGIETSSWWIKGLASHGQMGLYVSRSNIYLYFGRFFTLAFNALIAVRIEHGDRQGLVVGALALGFAAAVAVHAIALRGSPLTWRLMDWLRIILMLPKPSKPLIHGVAGLNWRMLAITATTSLVFSLGIAAPLILAVTFPAYRMSLSYIGQLVNAAGTLLLLFYVDQWLFRAFDREILPQQLPSYSIGRMLGFGVAGLLCYLARFAPSLVH